MNRRIFLGLSLLAAGTVAFGQPGSKTGQDVVLQLTVRGPIDPPTSEYVREGIAAAEAGRCSAVLIELDTPGGLLDATREIVSAMLNSSLPVIVYVAPSGARATSAGVFITMGADAAAMAPGTHIGAAHPVALGGGFEIPSKAGPSVMGEKAASDAAAYLRALAGEKGRNTEWAEQAVRRSISLTADEALRAHVVDMVVADRGQLFKNLAGRPVAQKNSKFPESLAATAVQDYPMSSLRRFLHTIANPNLAYFFLIFGIYAVIYEIASPSAGLGVVAGIVSLAVAGYALSILPVSYTGLLLLGLGIVLLALELKIASHGILTASGVTLLVLGSLFLFNTAEPYFRVAKGLIAGTAAGSAAFFVLAIAKVLEARRRPPVLGLEALIGQVGEVRQELNPRGMVFVSGELWSAEASEKLPQGTRVQVLGIDGNVLKVKKIEK